MANVAVSQVTINPHFMVPEVLSQYNQQSGAFSTVRDGEPSVKLSDGDLAVYVKRLDVRTKTAAGQSAVNQLPSVSIVANTISTPTYLVRTRAEYDHHDIAAMDRFGVSLQAAQRSGMRQGTFQQMRNALLYGMRPENGEGLMNAQGATAITLPADSMGHTSVQTYDNGEMAVFILAQIAALKARCNQMGVPNRIVILGPQRVLSGFEYQGIVQVTQFQRQGGGTASIGATVGFQAAMAGDSVEWEYDDTLIGKGAGGRDAIIITVPEIKTRQRQGAVNTNEFGELMPMLADINVMYCDRAAPTEYPTPLPGGATDIVSELRITSGWSLRPEALTIISATY